MTILTVMRLVSFTLTDELDAAAGYLVSLVFMTVLLLLAAAQSSQRRCFDPGDVDSS